jgi:hypothetical protein
VKCWVTVAKVRTFGASKCVHNLPQTSYSIGKLIATKYLKKKIRPRRRASGVRCAEPSLTPPQIK